MGNLFVKLAEYNPVNATVQAIPAAAFSGSSFETFLVRMYNIRPSINRKRLHIFIKKQSDGRQGGSTKYATYGPRIPAADTIGQRSHSDRIRLAHNVLSSTDSSPVTLEIYLFNMRNSLYNTVVAGRKICANHDSESQWTSDTSSGTVKRKTLSAGMDIAFDSGSIASGRIVLFGVAHTNQASADDAWKFISTTDSGGFVTTHDVVAPDFSNTYNTYRIIFHRLRGSPSSASSMWMRFRDQASGLFESAGYSYSRTGELGGSNSSFQGRSFNTSRMYMGRGMLANADWAGAVLGGDIIITGMRDASAFSSQTGMIGGDATTGPRPSGSSTITPHSSMTSFNGGSRNDSALKDGIQFGRSGGIDIRMSLFGLKEAA